METFIDTHCHLDGEEFSHDRAEVMQRAREAGCAAIFLPAIDLPSSRRILQLCRQYPGYLHPMTGLHPEEVRADWKEVLAEIKTLLTCTEEQPADSASGRQAEVIAIGEVGLDFYWSREFEQAQLAAFEAQVQWSVETRLPLMIHCRKAQNEMVAILKR
jgi:TatD DNase family protein